MQYLFYCVLIRGVPPPVPHWLNGMDFTVYPKRISLFVSYRVIFKKWTEAFSSRLHLPLSKGIFLEHVLTATGTALIPSPHPPHPVCSGKFRNQLATGCFFSKKMNPRGMYSTVIIILFYRQRVQIQVYGLIHFVQFHIVRKWQTQNL